MGYYISVLQKGKIYELDGQKLQFIEKDGNHYYFYICRMDEWSFRYAPTKETTSFDVKEINFIKRFQDERTNVGLKRIGKDKVFQRN